jgi:excisionase family DNA binding protein
MRMDVAVREDAPARIDQLPLMLTVREVAQILRIGRNEAYAAVADGSLPSVRIGRSIRIPRNSLGTLLGAARDASRPDAGPASAEQRDRELAAWGHEADIS